MDVGTAHVMDQLRHKCQLDSQKGFDAIVFSPDNTQIVTISFFGNLDMYNAHTNELLWELSTSHTLYSASFTGDGTLVAAMSRCGMVHIRYAKTGVEFKQIFLDGVGQFCPTDNNRFVTTNGDELVLWDIENGTKIWEITPGRDDYNDIENFARFSPDGKTIVTVQQALVTVQQAEIPEMSESESEEELEEQPNHVLVIDAANGSTKFSLEHDRFVSVYDASFSVDGRKLASVGSFAENHGICIIWDLSNGSKMNIIHLSHPIHSVAWARDFVQDNRRMAVAMSLHPNLGENSRLGGLEVDLVRMILDPYTQPLGVVTEVWI